MIHLVKQIAIGTVILFALNGCQKDAINKAQVDSSNNSLSGTLDKVSADLNASKAAQSIQVNVKGVRKNYQVTGTDPFSYQSWSYNWSERPEALVAFDQYFTVTTTGDPTEDQVNRGKHKAFQDNKCNFWFGIPLVQTVFVCGLDQNRTVTCIPKSPATYPAKTGWTLEVINGEGITIHLSNIFIASASYLEKSKASQGWSKKYSFTMRNDDQTSRLTGLTIELLHNGVVIDTRTPVQTLEDNVNWHYQANAGIYGNPEAFYAFESGMGSDRSVKSIEMGPLDDFSKNDEMGGTRALIPDQYYYGLKLTGNYSIRISGVVKGNDFIADKQFSIVEGVVSEGECGGGHHE
jgi:hypothetical protein